MIAKALLLVLLAAAPLPASGGPAFVATDPATGETILCRPLRPGDPIALVFTHSMFGGDVREEYVADPGDRLRRVAVTTANAAAAEYYAYTAGVLREGDRFRLQVPEVSFDRLVVRADRIGQHRIEVGEGIVTLVHESGHGRQVRLSIEHRPIWDRLPGGAC